VDVSCSCFKIKYLKLLKVKNENLLKNCGNRSEYYYAACTSDEVAISGLEI
jgi:hypothetical protein